MQRVTNKPIAHLEQYNDFKDQINKLKLTAQDDNNHTAIELIHKAENVIDTLEELNELYENFDLKNQNLRNNISSQMISYRKQIKEYINQIRIVLIKNGNLLIDENEIKSDILFSYYQNLFNSNSYCQEIIYYYHKYKDQIKNQEIHLLYNNLISLIKDFKSNTNNLDDEIKKLQKAKLKLELFSYDSRLERLINPEHKSQLTFSDLIRNHKEAQEDFNIFLTKLNKDYNYIGDLIKYKLEPELKFEKNSKVFLEALDLIAYVKSLIDKYEDFNLENLGMNKSLEGYKLELEKNLYNKSLENIVNELNIIKEKITNFLNIEIDKNTIDNLMSRCNRIKIQDIIKDKYTEIYDEISEYQNLYHSSFSNKFNLYILQANLVNIEDLIIKAQDIINNQIEE